QHRQGDRPGLIAAGRVPRTHVRVSRANSRCRGAARRAVVADESRRCERCVKAREAGPGITFWLGHERNDGGLRRERQMKIRSRMCMSLDGYVTTPDGWPVQLADPGFDPESYGFGEFQRECDA